MIRRAWGWLQSWGAVFRPGQARERCTAAGQHRPIIVDGGRSKLCPNCGTW